MLFCYFDKMALNLCLPCTVLRYSPDFLEYPAPDEFERNRLLLSSRFVDHSVSLFENLSDDFFQESMIFWRD